MADATGIRKYALLPLYIVVDTSYSMSNNGAIAGANQFVPALLDALDQNPSIYDKLRVSFMQFDTVPKTVVPLGVPGNLENFDTKLEAEGDATQYGALFQFLRTEIEAGVQACNIEQAPDGNRYRVFRPAVFVITDGDPTDREDVFMPAFASLTDEAFKAHPNMILVGMGRATKDSLTRFISGKSGAAIVAKDGVDPAQMLSDLIPKLAQSIVASITPTIDSAGNETLTRAMIDLSDYENSEDFDIVFD